jgi:putative tryptophan/tyrosine transport system substrate-binding protein
MTAEAATAKKLLARRTLRDNISALAAKAATKTIPIVFAGGGDPVQEGLVASLNRPGGNVTGVNFFAGVLGAKRLELLLQLVPKATTIAVLIYPNTTETEAERRDVQAAAQTIGRQLIILDVSSDRDIDLAFATFAERGARALLVGSAHFSTPNANGSSRLRLARGCRPCMLRAARPSWAAA